MRGVSKRFGAVTALSKLDFDVARGDVAVLLGRNGSGKSTLLRILGTTVIADSGKVRVAGHDVEEAPDAVRRSVGFLLADERSWYWRLSGRHNLEFFAALHGFRKEESRILADRLLDDVGLGESAHRPFGEYSSGMRLRLSLARALVATPPVLLLDEPTRSLDPIATKHFRDLVVSMAADRNAAVLIATHDLHEASAVATRVLVLVEGEIRGRMESPANSAELERMLIAVST